MQEIQACSKGWTARLVCKDLIKGSWMLRFLLFEGCTNEKRCGSRMPETTVEPAEDIEGIGKKKKKKKNADESRSPVFTYFHPEHYTVLFHTIQRCTVWSIHFSQYSQTSGWSDI